MPKAGVLTSEPVSTLERAPAGSDVEVIDLTKDDDESATPTPAAPVEARKRKSGSSAPDSLGASQKRRKKAARQGHKTTAGGAGLPPGSSVRTSTPLVDPPWPLPPGDDSPLAIYARYERARSAWYKSQPPDARTDQSYREAASLPLQYDEGDYQWCLDWRQMTGCCDTSTGSRKWTTEEMNAFLDWDRAEDVRVQAIVEKAGDKIRGPGTLDFIWKMVRRDMLAIGGAVAQGF